MHALRTRFPQPINRYRDVQSGNALITRDAESNVVRIRFPVADVGPADDPTAPGCDGTPQSIDASTFRIVMALLVVMTAFVWVGLLLDGPQ